MPDSFYQLIEARHGNFLVNPRDKYVGRGLAAYGEWGEAEVRLFAALLRPGDVAVEVGSNIGSHTVPISKMVGPEGVVHAFEPQRLVHQLLCANLALNSCTNVHAEKMAISDYIGQIQMCNIDPSVEFNYGSIPINLILECKSTMESCPISTIDALDFPKVDFLKIDAEGQDIKVLIGAKETIKRFRPAIFVEVNNDYSEFIPIFDELEYDCYWYFTRMFDDENFFGCVDNIWNDDVYIILSGDMLAVPRNNRWKVSGLVPGRTVMDWSREALLHDNYRFPPVVRQD